MTTTIFKIGLLSLEDVTKGQLHHHKNTHFMLVDGMSKLMSNQVKRCQSSDFHVSGLKWSLHIHSDVVKDYLSIYLRVSDERCTGPNWEVNCTVRLCVVSHAGVHNIFNPFAMYFKPKQETLGINSFLCYTVLKEKYLVHDKAVFGAEITNVYSSFPVTPIARTVGIAEHIKLMEVARKNSRFTWKITQFSSFDGVNHSSYEFTLGPRRWKIEMYPEGDLNGAGHLSLYLTATDYVTEGPKPPTLAVYKMKLLDQLRRNHYETHNEEWFRHPNENSWGKSKFLPLEELHNSSRGLLLNDVMYISVEFLFVSTTEYLF